MEDILIRPAKPEDTEGIIAHRAGIASEPDTYVSYTPEEANRAVEKERENIIKKLEKGDLCLVAVAAEGRIIAEIGCSIDHYFSITRHTAVLGMSVERNYRNQGIGSRMMEEAIKWAQEKRVVRLELEVYAENGPAIHLYEKNGFEVEGRKRKYAKQRGTYYDSLIMSRLFV